MTSYDLALEILKIVTPIISAVIAFILGRLSTNKTNKKQHLQDRFCGFYQPYVGFLKSGMLFSMLNKSNIESMDKLENLLYHKIHYADTETQKRSLFFLREALVWSVENNDQQLEVLTAKLDYLSEVVYKEYRYLCKQLKYPEPVFPISLSSLLNVKTDKDTLVE